MRGTVGIQIDINEEELREWATNQIKKRMGDRINSLMHEWDWEQYMRNAVDSIVAEKITDYAVKNVVNNMDKDRLIKSISQNIAEGVANSLEGN